MVRRAVTFCAWGQVSIRLWLAVILSLSGPGATFGQARGPTSESIASGAGGLRVTSDGAALTPPATGAVTHNIDSVTNECARYDPVYRIDCVRQGLNNLAKRIPANGDYGRARSLIMRASGKLGSIVQRNADNQAPKLETAPGANPRFRAKRRYTAIKKANLGMAMQQANAVMEELQTELLRASENSEKRRQHYQRIAAAVGSLKVLLRS